MGPDGGPGLAIQLRSMLHDDPDYTRQLVSAGANRRQGADLWQWAAVAAVALHALSASTASSHTPTWQRRLSERDKLER